MLGGLRLRGKRVRIGRYGDCRRGFIRRLRGRCLDGREMLGNEDGMGGRVGKFESGGNVEMGSDQQIRYVWCALRIVWCFALCVKLVSKVKRENL